MEQALRDTATPNLSYNRAGISKAVQYSCSSVQYSANPAKVHIQRSVSNLNRLQLPLLCHNILKGQVISPNIKGGTVLSCLKPRNNNKETVTVPTMAKVLREQMSPMPKASQTNEALTLGTTVKGVTESPEGRIRIFHIVF